MLKGNCHCGQVTWTFSSPVESVTACNCTLCRRYGALWAYGQLDQDIQVSGETKSYAWSNQINGFHFCTSCGCIAYYKAHQKNEKGFFRTAVNLRMITDPDQIAHLPIDHFEGLVQFEDLPRDGRCVKDLWF